MRYKFAIFFILDKYIGWKKDHICQFCDSFPQMLEQGPLNLFSYLFPSVFFKLNGNHNHICTAVELVTYCLSTSAMFKGSTLCAHFRLSSDLS